MCGTFRGDAHCLAETLGAHGHDHELLYHQAVAAVGSAVDDVEGGNGQAVLLYDEE